MQREAALISAYIQRLPAGITSCHRVVFALIEKGSGLLPAERIEVELYAVHLNYGRAFRSLKNAGIKRGKLFQIADPRICPFHQVLRLGEFANRIDYGLAA